MSVVTRPSMTDDSGTFDNGTVVDKAFVDAILDEVDDQVHSTTNPTVKPKATTDEVIAARGSLGSLDARLDVALNEDGTPKAVAGQATETQLASVAGNINLILNGDLEDWAGGASAAPDDFTLSGAGAAIARTGTGESDTTDLGTGTYAAKITSGGGAAAKLTQSPISSAEFSAQYRAIAGKSVGFAVRAKVASSNVLRLVIDDGVTTTASSYATGSANEQDLSVEHTLSASATKLDVYVEVALGTNSAYVGGFTCVFGLVGPSAWNPGWARFRQDLIDEVVPTQVKVGGAQTLVDAGGRLNVDYTDRSVSSASDTDSGWSFTLPANTLDEDGDELEIVIAGLWTTGSNSGTKKIVLFFGAQTFEVTSRGADTIAWHWAATIRLVRASSSTLRVSSQSTFATTSGGGSNFNGTQYALLSALDFTVTNEIKTQLNAGHASNTVVQKTASVRLVQ